MSDQTAKKEAESKQSLAAKLPRSINGERLQKLLGYIIQEQVAELEERQKNTKEIKALRETVKKQELEIKCLKKRLDTAQKQFLEVLLALNEHEERLRDIEKLLSQEVEENDGL